MKSPEINKLPPRIVQLIAPFAVSFRDSDKFTNQRTKNNMEIILNKFFSKNKIDNLNFKLANHEVFLVKLIDLINAELDKRKDQVTTGIKTKIRDIFKNEEDFKASVLKAASESFNSPYFRKELSEGSAMSDLKDTLIDQIDKLLSTTASGDVKLNFLIDYNPHFKTGTDLVPSDFKLGGATHILTKRGSSLEVNEVIRSTTLPNNEPLVVGHGLDGNYKDKLILVPVSLLNEINSKNIREGFKDAKGVVHHNIFVSDGAGKKLVSKLDFSSNGYKIRKGEWTKQFSQYNVLLKDSQIIGYEANFYAAYVFASGENFHAGLQDTTVTLEHIEPVNLPLHQYGFIDPIRDLQGRGDFLFTSVDTKQYGGFTSENLFNVFYEIMDPRRHIEKDKRLSIASIIPYLPQLNGLSNIGNNDFTSGLDLKKINENIKDIKFNDLESLKFSWKQPSGEILQQSMKAWLNLIYDKVLQYSPSGPNGDILTEQIELSKYTRMSDNPTFTDTEAKLAKLIFSSANKLFGHFTIRLILSGMVDFNLDKTIRFTFRPNLGDLTQLHNNIHFVPPRKGGNSPIANYKADTYDIDHLMGILFLDSKVWLPGLNDLYEQSLDFPMGPLIGLSEDVKISSYSKIQYSRKLSTALRKAYINEHGSGYNFDIKNRFIESQTNLYNAIERKINAEVKNYFTDNTLAPEEKVERRKWLANRLLRVARLELFQPDIKTDAGRYYLRSQIELFLTSPDSLREIEFYNVPDPNGNGNFKLKLFREDVEGIDFNSWGQPNEIYSQEFKNLRKTLLSANILNSIKIVERIIKTHGNSKVRIFPLVNSKKADMGYQYVYTTSGKEQLRLNNIAWLPKNPSYFDIDLSGEIGSDSYKKSQYKLIHIMHLLLAQNTMFVIKEEGSVVDTSNDNGEFICAFDFTGFVSKEDIFSAGRNHVIRTDSYLTNFYDRKILDGFMSEWNNNWQVFGFTSQSKSSDFWEYMQIIKGRVGDMGAYLSDLLSQYVVAS